MTYLTILFILTLFCLVIGTVNIIVILLMTKEEKKIHLNLDLEENS
ncbi:TMhelix containing protein [Vibrio phage 1.081.O._10N.286.52.C2]|nr:TMhelix containing protein [Vibrio phage 1.081.O._10N.286.52.C2]